MQTINLRSFDYEKNPQKILTWDKVNLLEDQAATTRQIKSLYIEIDAGSFVTVVIEEYVMDSNGSFMHQTLNDKGEHVLLTKKSRYPVLDDSQFNLNIQKSQFEGQRRIC